MKKTQAPAFKRHVWIEAEVARLGTMSDADLAANMALDIRSVRRKRNLLGIPPYRPAKDTRWGRREIALLGKLPDAQVARFMGIHMLTVGNKRRALGIQCYARKSKSWRRWTAKEIAMLGTMPDGDVAEKTGIKKASVAWKRCKLKIPPYTHKRPKKLLTDWTRKEISKLGKMTDADAAATLDLAFSAVRAKRLSLGIPPYGRRSGNTTD